MSETSGKSGIGTIALTSLVGFVLLVGAGFMFNGIVRDDFSLRDVPDQIAIDRERIRKQPGTGASTSAGVGSVATAPDVLVEAPEDTDATAQADTVPTIPEIEIGSSDANTRTDTLGEPDPVETLPLLPSFDLVRIDNTGSGIVAGRAEPGSQVRIISGDQEVASANVNAKGEFVAFISTPSSTEGQSLQLVARGQAGGDVTSAEQVFILPGGTQEEAPLAPTLVKADEEGVRVIQPSGPASLDRVSLDTISYDETGEVVLAGRGVAGEQLRIYLNGEPVSEGAISSSGSWKNTVTDIREGRYTLRIDALDAGGNVTSRVESPFQRVFPASLQDVRAVTVQPGNTLWVMAQERYGDGFQYTQIFAANKDIIRDPDLIYPGQIFDLPKADQITE